MSFSPLSYVCLFSILCLFSEEIERRNNIRKVCQVENDVIDILDANKCLMITVQDYSEDPDVDQIDSGAGFLT